MPKQAVRRTKIKLGYVFLNADQKLVSGQLFFMSLPVSGGIELQIKNPLP